MPHNSAPLTLGIGRHGGRSARFTRMVVELLDEDKLVVRALIRSRCGQRDFMFARDWVVAGVSPTRSYQRGINREMARYLQGTIATWRGGKRARRVLT